MVEEIKVLVSVEIGQLKKELKEAKKQVEETAETAKKSSSKFKGLGDEFIKLGEACKKGLAVAATAIAAVATALLALPGATEEYRTAQAKLNAAFESAGGEVEQAKETYNELYRVLGDGDVAVEAANHLAQLTTNQKELAEWTTICEGVYATFGDSLPIEGLTEAANETAKVGQVTGTLADALNWAGVSEDAFNEKLAACNTEAEREALIRETLNGIYTEAAANYEKNAEGLLAANEAQAALDESMAQLGETMEPIMTTLKELAAEVLADLAPYLKDFAENNLPAIKDALSGLGEKIGEVIKWIGDNWDMISTVGAIVLGVAAAIAVLSAGLTAYNTIMAITSAVSLPVIGIIAAIVAGIALLVTAIVLCVKHWDEIKAKILEVWENIKTAVTNGVQYVKDKFGEMKDRISEKADEIKANVKEKFEAVKETMRTVMEAARATVNEKLTNIKNAYNEHGGGIKGIAAGFIEAVKGYYTAGYTFIDNLTGGKLSSIASTIKGKLNEAKNTVSTILGNIKDKFNSIFENAKTIVSNAINKIKSIMNFQWSLPKLKLPRISISGKFSLSPLEVPKFSITWNRLGGVFENPTIFGFGNSLQGLGEDGAEAVVPLEKNTAWMNVLATKLSERMSAQNTPIVLQVDGKTFAQTSINTINQLTRQTGSLGLALI